MSNNERKFNEWLERARNSIILGESDDKVREKLNKALGYKADINAFGKVFYLLSNHRRYNLLEGYINILKRGYPNDIEAVALTGMYYITLNKFDKSIKYMDKALKLNSKIKTLSDNHIIIIRLQFFKILLFILLDKYENALQSIDEFINMLSKIESQNLENIVSMLCKLYELKIILLYILDEKEEALELRDKYLTIVKESEELKEIFVNNIASEAIKWYYKGIIYESFYYSHNYATGLEKALECYTKALEIDSNFKLAKNKKEEIECLIIQ